MPNTKNSSAANRSEPVAGVDYVGVCTPFICIDGAGRVLLNLRGRNCRDEHGTWDNGAGALAHFSSFEENVVKEVKEEYGCDAIVLAQLPTLNVLRCLADGTLTHWVAIPFVVLVDPAQVRNNEPDKFAAVGWFDPSDLPEPLHSTARKLLAHPIVQKYLDTYRRTLADALFGGDPCD